MPGMGPAGSIQNLFIMLSLRMNGQAQEKIVKDFQRYFPGLFHTYIEAVLFYADGADANFCRVVLKKTSIFHRKVLDFSPGI